MPELPDLVYVANALSRNIVGHRIAGARIGDPTVLRLMLPTTFAESLTGRTVTSVERRGHFLRFGFDGELVVVVNAMLVGKYRWHPSRELPPPGAPPAKDPSALGFAWRFEDGSELRYIDDKRMGKVYLAALADEGAIPVYASLGTDLLSPAFDRVLFAELASRRRDQVRVFLMDKSALASIGNAYADEILFAAGLHPKTMVRKLTRDDVERLFMAIRKVLAEAIAEIARRNEPIDVKVRDFLAVRGRAGKPCPRCGTTIRAVRVSDGDACFCPRCQPATRRLFVDWGALPEASGPDVAHPGATGASEAARAPGPVDPSAASSGPRSAAGGRARSRPRSRR